VTMRPNEPTACGAAKIGPDRSQDLEQEARRLAGTKPRRARRTELPRTRRSTKARSSVSGAVRLPRQPMMLRSRLRRRGAGAQGRRAPPSTSRLRRPARSNARPRCGAARISQDRCQNVEQEVRRLGGIKEHEVHEGQEDPRGEIFFVTLEYRVDCAPIRRLFEQEARTHMMSIGWFMCVLASWLEQMPASYAGRRSRRQSSWPLWFLSGLLSLKLLFKNSNQDAGEQTSARGGSGEPAV
jgi:hypothetical protein